MNMELEYKKFSQLKLKNHCLLCAYLLSVYLPPLGLILSIPLLLQLHGHVATSFKGVTALKGMDHVLRVGSTILVVGQQFHLLPCRSLTWMEIRQTVLVACTDAVSCSSCVAMKPPPSRL